MRLLILGGTGFVSGEIARQAVATGAEVVLFHRGTSRSALPCRWIPGDVDELAVHRVRLRDLAPDAVVHCVAFHEGHSQDLVELFEGVDAHLVVLGSMDCYEVFYQARHGREVSDFPVDERMPTSSVRRYWAGTSHAPRYDKNLMTDALLAAHREGRAAATVLRLPMVYGPGDGQFPQRHGAMIWHALDRRETVVLGALEGATIWTFGYVGNVAAAVLAAVGNPATRGGVYNVGEAKSRTKRRWYDLYAAAAGHAFRYRTVPDELLEGRPAGGDQAKHLFMDSSAFRSATGFQEPFSVEEAVARTYAWAREHRDRLGPAPDYAAREALARAYAAAVAELERRF